VGSVFLYQVERQIFPMSTFVCVRESIQFAIWDECSQIEEEDEGNNFLLRI